MTKNKNKQKSTKGGAPTSDSSKKTPDNSYIQKTDSIIYTILNSIFCYSWILGVFLLTLLIAIILIIYKLNLFNIGTNYPYIAGIFIGIFSLLLAIIFLFINYYNARDDPTGNQCINYETASEINNDFITVLYKFLFLLVVIIAIISIIYIMFSLVLYSKDLLTILMYIIIGLFIIVTLAILFIIIYSTSTNKITKEDKTNFTWGTFIKNYIFYIPCLLIEYIEYIQKQFNMTTKPVWILLILEIIIICMYFLLPFIYKRIVFHEGKELLTNPVYTNKLTSLGKYQNLTLNTYTPNTNKVDYNYNYGISLFLYINPQPVSTSSAYTTYTSLFNYANKPNILYNAQENTLKIVCLNNKNDLVDVYKWKNFPYQKWIHFVINYNSGTVDVFIDNNLVSSVSGVMPYMTVDKITAGSNNGINGGIKNVIYFNKIIPKSQIALLISGNN